MNWYQIYFWIASVTTFWGCMTLNTKLQKFDNFIGSLIIAVALGWLIWPFAAFARFRYRQLGGR